MLAEKEKTLFKRLSAFSGSWTLLAAETVCDIQGDIAPEIDDALAALIDNNMVLQLSETDDQPRFGMLSTIHDYAAEKLNEDAQTDTIYLQQAQFFLDFVTRVEPLIRSSERVKWQQVMQDEFTGWTQQDRCIEDLAGFPFD